MDLRPLPSVDEAFDAELAQARRWLAGGDLALAFSHLERAHILGQRETLRHARVHGLMLRIGWLRGDLREVLGQSLRVLAAFLVSRIWVPSGNTGGSNVSALRPMPLPGDLAAIFAEERRLARP